MHAHEAGLVHRDVKPDNVLVCHEASGTLYKLSDLATACRLTDDQSHAKVAGTPAYMAPEQFYDKAGVQSDLYGLGVTFFELLAQQRPFDGPPERLFTAHQHEAPPLHLIADAGSRALLEQLLAKKPKDRPVNAQAVLDMIEALQLTEARTCETPRIDDNTVVEYPAAVSDQIDTDNSVDATPLEDQPLGPAQGPILKRLSGTRVQFAQRVLLMQSKGKAASTTALVTEKRWTDALAVERGSYTNHRYTDRLLCGMQCDNGQVIAVTPRHVVSIDSETGQLRRLFEHGSSPSPEVIAVSSCGSLQVCADYDRLFSFDAAGGHRWSIRQRSYVFSPCLVVLDHDTIAVASGPMGPHIRLLNSDGKLIGTLACPGPVRGIFPGSENRMHVLTQGQGTTPARWMTCAGTTVLHEATVDQMIYGGASLARDGSAFATWATDDWLRIHDATGRVITQRKLEGNVIDSNALPASRDGSVPARLALLISESGRRSWQQLQVYAWRAGPTDRLSRQVETSPRSVTEKGSNDGMSL